MSAHAEPLFIVGIQKSGTTLLNRLLLQHPKVFYSPFKLEGRAFWGDDPPFSPTASPCGVLYQKKSGQQGHHLDATDFTVEDQQLLQQRISDSEATGAVLINKNPYNTVRIAWLKRVFPACKIVAIIRNPMANVFSLQKKHIPHEDRGLGPEDGWWGVKPPNWLSINDASVINKVAQQYRATNACLLDQMDQVDMLISYSQLCESPNEVITQIAELYGINLNPKIEPISSRDHEYKTGGRLLSINREHAKQNGNFAVDDAAIPIELAKLTWRERWHIKRSCAPVWRQAQQHLIKITPRPSKVAP